MKKAIILAGPYRSQDWMIERHNECIGEYDTYVSCRAENADDWKNSNWKIKELFITPELNEGEVMWSDVGNKNEYAKWLLDNLYWQYRNIGHCFNSIKEDYDIYIRSRGDMVYETKLDIPFESITENEIWCPAKTFWGYEWVSNGYFNDQLWICKKRAMSFVAQFYSDALKLNNGFGEVIRKELFQNLILEPALVAWLLNCDIHQKKFDYHYTKNYNGITGSAY